MKLRIVLPTLLFLLALSGCQTTDTEEANSSSEQSISATSPKDPIANEVGFSIYRPIEDEKFTYALVNTDKIPQKQLRFLQEEIENGLRSANKFAESGTAARHLDVLFTSYRMRATGARFAFGILAGTDKVETRILIKDSKGGEVLHTKLYRTGSAIAFRGTGDILRKHAKKIVDYVVDGKKK